MPWLTIHIERYEKTRAVALNSFFIHTWPAYLTTCRGGGGCKGFEGVSVYDTTKAAVRSSARSWTVDLKNRKIRVNAVTRPGPIATPMLSSRGMGLSEEQFEEFKKNALSMIPLGRMGHPDEIAKAAFLASDDSSYITGIELFVDGGLAQI